MQHASASYMPPQKSIIKGEKIEQQSNSGEKRSQEVSSWTSCPSRGNSGVRPSCSELGPPRSCKEMAQPGGTTPIQSGPLYFQFRSVVPFPPQPPSECWVKGDNCVPRPPGHVPAPPARNAAGSSTCAFSPGLLPNQLYVPETHFWRCQTPRAALGDGSFQVAQVFRFSAGCPQGLLPRPSQGRRPPQRARGTGRDARWPRIGLLICSPLQ